MPTGTQMTDGLVLATARAFTRRRLLRNAGAVALGAAFTTTLTRDAWAHGSHGSPCGPSPICPDAACNSTFNCNTADTARRRNYNTFDCGTDTASNCWTEDYTGCGGYKWKCCDCCAYHGTGNVCSGCTNTKRACICRSRCDITDGCSQWPNVCNCTTCP